jgi:hypothetical protein
MPPDIATMRRVMMYVPIMAAAMEMMATPISANLKNEYSNTILFLSKE